MARKIKFFGEGVFDDQRKRAVLCKVWTLYKITNKVNSKVYIGQTNQEPNKRMSKHFYDAKSGRKNVAISSALNKYGKDGFTYEILQYTNSSEDADSLEIDYIKYFKSNQKEFGYNLTDGGKSVSKSFQDGASNRKGSKMTLEHKNILIEVDRRRKRPPMSEEQKLLSSQIMREKHRLGLIKSNLPILHQKGELHPMFGKPQTEEAKKKISIHAENEREIYAEKVVNLYITGRTIGEISKGVNLCKETISKILRKHNVKIRTKGDYEKRKVYRYSKEGDFIDEWESEPDLIKNTGIFPAKSLRGIGIFASDFFFSYKKMSKEETLDDIKERQEKVRKKRIFTQRKPMPESQKKMLAEINKGNDHRGKVKNIKQIDKNGNLIKIWLDSKEIVTFYGLKNATPILRVLRGERKHFKKFKWSL